MKFDFLGALIGKAARRQLEKEISSGNVGPVLKAVVPVLLPQVETDAKGLINAAMLAAEKKVGLN